MGENRVSLGATRRDSANNSGTEGQPGSPGGELKSKTRRIMGIMNLRGRPKRDHSFTTLRDKVVDTVSAWVAGC